MIFLRKVDLRKTFSLVFFFLILFGSLSIAYGEKASPFEIEMFSPTKGSPRSLRLVTGDLSMEMIPVEITPGFSLQNSLLVIQKKKLPMEMEYVVDNRSIKENVSLDQYRKIDRITFELKLKNLTYKQANGLIGFYDTKGKTEILPQSSLYERHGRCQYRCSGSQYAKRRNPSLCGLDSP